MGPLGALRAYSGDDCGPLGPVEVPRLLWVGFLGTLDPCPFKTNESDRTYRIVNFLKTKGALGSLISLSHLFFRGP